MTETVADRLHAEVKRRHSDEITAVRADQPLDSDIVGFVDTQAPSLNYAIGQPGYPKGRLTLLVGKPKAGKSTLGYHALQETQRLGGVAILVDAERRYSRDRAERMGIDHQKLIYIPGTSVEATFKELYAFCTVFQEDGMGEDADLTIVWDSLAGTPLEAELKQEGSTAGHAKVVGKWFRVLLPQMAHKKITFIMINQLRTKIDMGGGTFFSAGPSDTMLADRALSFHCSLKIFVTQIQKVGTPDPVGIVSKADVQFNTTAPPYRKGLVHIDFVEGLNRDACAFEAAKTIKLIKETGSGWWQYKGGPKFQGARSAKWSEVLHGSEELQRLLAEAPNDWRV